MRQYAEQGAFDTHQRRVDDRVQRMAQVFVRTDRTTAEPLRGAYVATTAATVASRMRFKADASSSGSRGGVGSAAGTEPPLLELPRGRRTHAHHACRMADGMRRRGGPQQGAASAPRTDMPGTRRPMRR